LHGLPNYQFATAVQRSGRRRATRGLSAMESILLIALFTLLSGWGDAHGFVHAGKVWSSGSFDGVEALKSAAGFQFGVFMYWFAARHLAAHGVVAPEVQTLFWFAATIIGIAAMSGHFVRWPFADQATAVAVLLGIGWLMVRTAHVV